MNISHSFYVRGVMFPAGGFLDPITGQFTGVGGVAAYFTPREVTRILRQIRSAIKFELDRAATRRKMEADYERA